MLLQTILNKVEKLKGFVYSKARFAEVNGSKAIIVSIRERRNGKPLCSGCKRPMAKNGRQSPRLFQFVPLWGFPVYFEYALRRVSCKLDGDVVEWVPWAAGKHRHTRTFMIFLAQWARRLSWLETARVFHTSWDSVINAIRYVVDYGLKHRNLDGITQIGVDEISVKKGQSGYLTVVYQLDKGTRRLLWTGRDRTTETLAGFFRWLGQERTAQLRFICSDMWKPYLKAVRENASHLLHVLDRFHVMANMNEAVDNVRKGEMRRLGKEGAGKVLYRGRWALLKRVENLSEKQATKLSELLKTNLDSVKAYLLKQEFDRFWQLANDTDAGLFLGSWVKNVRKTKLRPMHWMAKKIDKHKPLLLNWYKAKGEMAMGAVEGLNLKAKLILRKAYGIRSLDNVELALYHGLGGLPEPPTTHRFT